MADNAQTPVSVANIKALLPKFASTTVRNEIDQRLLELIPEELLQISATKAVVSYEAAYNGQAIPGTEITIHTVINIDRRIDCPVEVSPASSTETIKAGTGYSIQGNKAVIPATPAKTTVTVVSSYKIPIGNTPAATYSQTYTFVSNITCGNYSIQAQCSAQSSTKFTASDSRNLSMAQVRAFSRIAVKQPEDWKDYLYSATYFNFNDGLSVGSYLYVLVDIASYDQVSGGKCGFVLESVYISSVSNQDAVNVDHYSATKLYEELEKTYYPALSQECKDAIAEVYIPSCPSVGAAPQMIKAHMFLPSDMEIAGKSKRITITEGTQFAYHAARNTSDSLVKYSRTSPTYATYWAMRTVFKASNDYCFEGVYSTGGVGQFQKVAAPNLAIAPIVCIKGE